MNTNKNVADWLREDCEAKLAAPIAVKIGRETYWGASYFEPSWDGKSGEPILYLLGNVPAAYKRSRRVCWQFPNDSRDWYLAGFADAAVARALPQFHPYGAWFQLRCWPVVLPDGSHAESIDHYHSSPYRRMRVAEVNDA